jgi:hypothetical protein
MAKKKTVKKQAIKGDHIPVLGAQDEYIMEYAPSLMPVYLTLLPFSYLFGSTSAGPQKQAKNYDPAEPPHIELHIDDPRYPGGDTDGVSLYCRITAEKITLHWYCINGAGGENYHEESEITLAGLWDYLRQIPKPYECFCKGDE